MDTGIHCGQYKWTRKQAVEYMLKNTGLTEGDAKSEVDRYIAWPGQVSLYPKTALK